MRVNIDLKTPMRDGVNLVADLYYPEEGERFPVLLLRSPYSTQFPRYMEWMKRFVAAGYAVFMQDCRGRYKSEGIWRPYVDETNDGYDTQEWIGIQPWCDGRIGMFGSSYPGFTQILPATQRSSFVKGLVPMANQEDNYGHLRCNGVLQLQNSVNFVWLGDRLRQEVTAEYCELDEIYRRLPLVTALDDLADRPFYRDIVRHPNFDDFWKSYSMKGRYSEVDVPAYFVTGWYDNLVHEGFKCFSAWKSQARTQEARRFSRMLIGPWTHGQIGSGERFGDIEFGPAAAADIPGLHVRWYDQRIRGLDTGIDDEPPVRIFVMGENMWRGEEEWPLARTQFTQFFLHSAGGANSLFGDGELNLEAPGTESPDCFTYDPADPVPTLGGQSMFAENTGPRDRCPVERRDDVLVYTSSPLVADVEVTGPIELTLYAASSAPDTDFTATLVDVHPGGKAINISEGIVRARFRDSLELAALIAPGATYQYRIEVWETSNLFKAGHCIRVEVSSSNFPRFDRNLNTGRDGGTDSRFEAAKQTVYHDGERPSHITLPVIPR
jgi:putative CocE/NonD family hydrolase